MKETKTYTPHLVIATGIYPPQIGGPATYAKLLVDELPKRGWEVGVVNFGDVRHLPRFVRHVVYAVRLYKALRFNSIILALDPVSVGLPSFIVSRITGRKYIVKVVGDYAWEQGIQRFDVRDSLDDFVKRSNYPLQVRFLRYFQVQITKRAEKVITPSFYLKNIVAQWGISEDKISVIYNAMSSQPEIHSKEDIRLKYGIDGFVILTAGRLVPWKRVGVVIRALEDIKKSIPDARLIIAGSGPEERKLKEIVAGNNVVESVSFTGDLPQDMLWEYVSMADVFVLNSSYEGLSHVLLEVMMLGTPIVASNAGGNPELIENLVNGLLVRGSDEKELAQAVVTLQNEEYAQQLVQESKKKVATFSVENMVNNFIDTI